MNKILIIRNAAEKAVAGENNRATRLAGKAEKLIAGTIVVTGFQLLSASNVLGSGSRWAEGKRPFAFALRLAAFWRLPADHHQPNTRAAGGDIPASMN